MRRRRPRSAGTACPPKGQARLERVRAEALRLDALAGQSTDPIALVGARPLIDEVRPLAAISGTVGPGADVLTPREVEVLALGAEGASNRDVGLRLFISTKTVSVHVSNILAKLGGRSRTEAVAVARRRGLLA